MVNNSIEKPTNSQHLFNSEFKNNNKMTIEKYTYTSIMLIKLHQIELYFNIPTYL